MVKYKSYRAGGSSRVPIPKTVGRKRRYSDIPRTKPKKPKAKNCQRKYRK